MKLLVFLCIVTILVGPILAIRPGGITDNEKPADKKLKTMLKPIQPALKSKIAALSNGPVSSLTPISYKTQVVAGTNYFVKYQVNNSDEYFHVRIYKDLDDGLEISKVIGPMTLDDPIEYIELP